MLLAARPAPSKRARNFHRQIGARNDVVQGENRYAEDEPTQAKSDHGLTMAKFDGTHNNGGLMTVCMQPQCIGTIVDGYCDVCGSPAGAAPFVPAGSVASAGLSTGCTQPGCTGRIVDGYCDVCGSPAGAAPFVPAGSAASAGLSTGCTQPGCTGWIVDGYCDLCGSPAGAAPFVPAGLAASVASSTAADERGLTAVLASTHASAPAEEEMLTQRIPQGKTPRQPVSTQEMSDRGAADPGAVNAQKGDGEKELAQDGSDRGLDYRRRVEETQLPDEVRKAALREVDELERTSDQNPESGEIQTWLDTILDLPWKAGPAVADVEQADASLAGPEHGDTAKMPAVPAALGGGQHQHAQFPEQQVFGPEPVQTPAKRRRFGSLALAAIALVALLIGALFFVVSRDGSVAGRSVPAVTATATATVSKPPNKPSDKSTAIAGEKATVQLEDLADSGRPFQPVRIHGTYRGGADTFLQVQRWEGGKWLAFPLPTKTDHAGQFTTYVELEKPGRYQLRMLDPNSGVTSKTFVLVIKG